MLLVCFSLHPTRKFALWGQAFLLVWVAVVFKGVGCIYSRGSINVDCINKSRFLEKPRIGHEVFTRIPVCDGKSSVSTQ